MNVENVLIVGAGHAAGELALAVRSLGYLGEIILLGAEVHRPYQRPALSKGFLTGQVTLEQLYLRSEAHFEKAKIQFMPMSRVVSIDRAGKSVTRVDGRSFIYSKLVLATGGRP